MECVEKIELILKILGTLISIMAFSVGLYALITWRKQIKYKVVYENALKFEANLTKFAFYSVNDIRGEKKLKGCNDNIIESYYVLVQRRFMLKETYEVNEEYQKCLDYLRISRTTTLPSDLRENLVAKLNIFSDRLQKAF